MNTIQIFKLEYKLSRFNRGIIDSFIRAVKAAIRPPAF